MLTAARYSPNNNNRSYGGPILKPPAHRNYIAGVTRIGKTGKQKSRSESKVIGFSSASLFPERKWEAVTQGRTRGTDHSTRRRTQGVGTVKVLEDKRDRGCIADTFT